jgi:hypothetical protein
MSIRKVGKLRHPANCIDFSACQAEKSMQFG